MATSERRQARGIDGDVDAKPAKPIAVIYRAAESLQEESLLPGDSQAQREHRNEFRRHLTDLLVAQLFEHGLQGSVYECGPTMTRTHYDELACEVGVAMIDLEALHSADFARVASFLAWRARLGLPLVVPLLGSVEPEDLASSQLRALSASALLRPRNPTNDEAPNEYADEIAAQVVQVHRSRHIPPTLDPATMWAKDVAAVLTSLAPYQLDRLAAHLQVDPSDITQQQKREEVLAASLFGASLDNTFKFLRQAAEALDGTSAKRVLVERALPLWVNLDAGRLVLSAAEMPPRSRVCGIGLSRLDFAEHAVKRGSANAPGFPTVGLPGNGGEHIAAELAIRHDETLRDVLNLQHDDPPEFIASQLASINRAVFALLDCAALSPESTQELVIELMGRFPGITFVLVSQSVVSLNSSFHSLATAEVIMDDLMARRVEFYVANTLALLGEEVKQ